MKATVTVTILPEWQVNYSYEWDEVLVIVDSEYRDDKQYYQVLGMSGTCWIEAEQLRLVTSVRYRKQE